MEEIGGTRRFDKERLEGGLESVAWRRAREVRFAGDVLKVGRDPSNDVVLDDPQVSAFHAELRRVEGGCEVVDLRSLNGVWSGGKRARRARLTEGQPAYLGPYVLAWGGEAVWVYDVGRECTLDAVKVGRREGEAQLLQDVSLRLRPGTLVGLIGPSGAGKSTLLRALNGLRPASEGTVRLNGLDLYAHYEVLKRSLGYVPQDDIIHRELTPERTLDYVSQLRLPKDTGQAQRREQIEGVLGRLELDERKRVPIRMLSGGQRKRVSLGVELLTEPHLIFLDEPTAGLDPGLEAKMMGLFRGLADQGRTVVVTTHLMDHVRLFDTLVVLVRGRLACCGTPEEVCAHFGIDDLRDIFRVLAEREPEAWAEAYRSSPMWAVHSEPAEAPAEVPKEVCETGGEVGVRRRLLRGRRRPFLGGQGLRQWWILTRRYASILLRDRRNTVLLLAQAPVIACFVALAMESVSYIAFMLSLSAIWFGTSNAAKELVKELPIYQRERMVNLGLVPYVLSKVGVLFVLAGLQCALLLGVVGAFREIPGSGLALYGALLLTSLAALATGLFVSAAVSTVDKATALVPLVLIPQVLFAGLFTPLTGPTGWVSMAMPSRWSYDLLKRTINATHTGARAPLLDFADKGEEEDTLFALEGHSKYVIERVDALAAEVPRASARVRDSWAQMEGEVGVLEAQEEEVRAAYARLREDLAQTEGTLRAIEGTLEGQRAAVEQVQGDLLQLSQAWQAQGPAALEALTPDWVEQRRAVLEQGLADYQALQGLVEEVRAQEAPLRAEEEAMQGRVAEAERAKQALQEGALAIEREVRTLRGVALALDGFQAALRGNAQQIREIQGRVSDDLREGRYVYMAPGDTLERDVLALGGFSGLFLLGAMALQRRRDR